MIQTEIKQPTEKAFTQFRDMHSGGGLVEEVVNDGV